MAYPYPSPAASSYVPYRGGYVSGPSRGSYYDSRGRGGGRARNKTLVLNNSNNTNHASQPHIIAPPKPGSSSSSSPPETTSDVADAEEELEPGEILEPSPPKVSLPAPAPTPKPTSVPAPTSKKYQLIRKPGSLTLTNVSSPNSNQTLIRSSKNSLVSKEVFKEKQQQRTKQVTRPATSHPTPGIQQAPKSPTKGPSVWKSRTSAAPPTLQQNKLKNKQCPFFTKKGTCGRGLTCPFQHDPSKIAICQRFLRNNACTNHSCPLSHSPTPHNTPNCVHFPNCRNAENCTYSHAILDDNAGICKDFATTGYCESGLACRRRHTWECAEFAEKGICTIPGCKRPHVIRRSTPQQHHQQEPKASSASASLPASTAEKPLSAGKKREASPEAVSWFIDAGPQTKRMKTDDEDKDSLVANEDFVVFVDSDEDKMEGVEDDDEKEEEEEEDEDEQEQENRIEVEEGCENESDFEVADELVNKSNGKAT